LTKIKHITAHQVEEIAQSHCWTLTISIESLNPWKNSYQHLKH